MIRAYAPSCAPLRTGHGCPALPLWAPQVMRVFHSRMTAETARTGARHRASPHRARRPRHTQRLKEKRR